MLLCCLQKLDLSHNKLKSLSVETIELLENALELERLELHNNLWTCDITNYHLARLVHHKHLLVIVFSFVTLVWRRYYLTSQCSQQTNLDHLSFVLFGLRVSQCLKWRELTELLQLPPVFNCLGCQGITVYTG